jgi:signal transduction histidine kinase
VADALRLVRMKAEMGGLALVAEVEQPGLRLWADERAVKQMLFNLLANAVKFTPRGGSVSLIARASAGQGTQLVVRDTGIGIPPEDVSRVMKPFEQIDNRFSRSRGGTGLGLSLVQGLIGLHNGTLSVDSTVGVGTIFTLDFPNRKAEP